MKVVLNAAVTVDGYIATKNDDTSWVSEVDWEIFIRMVNDFGCVIMGRRNYEVNHSEIPYGEALNIVMARSKTIPPETGNVIITDKSPKNVLRWVEQRGIDRVLIIGGGRINGAFLKEGLVDEVNFDVHPLVLGVGVRVFGDLDEEVSLSLVDEKMLDKGLVWLRYKVLPASALRVGKAEAHRHER